MVRVGAAPLADGLVEQVAGGGIGTAMSDDARRLVGQMLGGIDHLRFERDLVTDVFAVLDLVNLPGSIRHVSLLTIHSVRRLGQNRQ